LLEERELKEDYGAEDVKIEERQWDEIKPRPFDTVKVSYVVCLNTMGQDRPYTEEEFKFALRTVRDYRDKWE
jgi:hypothetical protein